MKIMTEKWKPVVFPAVYYSVRYTQACACLGCLVVLTEQTMWPQIFYKSLHAHFSTFQGIGLKEGIIASG